MKDDRPLGDMEHVKHGGEIDLRTWEFFECDPGLEGVLMKGFAVQVTDVLREQFKDDPPKIWLPFMWRDGDGIGGSCPDDPLMLYVTLQLGENDNGVTYACSFEEVVDDLIDSIVCQGEESVKVEDPEDQETCAKLAARLRELANKLDAVCAVETIR